MNWSGWLLWGFVATIVLTTILSTAQGLGLTRISLPYILGSVFTPDRDRAKVIGVLVHLLNGWLSSLLYVLVFQAMGAAGWWRGALIGLLQAVFVLSCGMEVLPGLHPRMASERHGPTVERQLEPPGFLALHYGTRTPLAVVFAHLAFGILLGALYKVH